MTAIFEQFQTREDLVAAVESAQRAALDARIKQGSRSKACRLATERRDILESALIAYDTAQQNAGVVKVAHKPLQTVLDQQIADWRLVLSNAGAANNAAGVARANRVLEDLYKRRDNTPL